MDAYTPHELETKLMKYRNDCANYGDAYAEAKAKFISIDKRRDDVLAQYTSQQEGRSIAEKERKARLTDKWDIYQNGRISAEQDMIGLKIKYDVARISWETCKIMIFMRINEAKGFL